MIRILILPWVWLAGGMAVLAGAEETQETLIADASGARFVAVAENGRFLRVLREQPGDRAMYAEFFDEPGKWLCIVYHHTHREFSQSHRRIKHGKIPLEMDRKGKEPRWISFDEFMRRLKQVHRDRQNKAQK